MANRLGKQWLTILGGSKIPEDGDCSHEIKRRLLLGRKVMANLDSILLIYLFIAARLEDSFLTY